MQNLLESFANDTEDCRNSHLVIRESLELVVAPVLHSRFAYKSFGFGNGQLLCLTIMFLFGRERALHAVA